MPNTAAKRVIDTYLLRKNPDYALLVDAPFGSGKTHLVKQVTNCDADPTRLYVTLYDVQSSDAFDWALVRAINPWSEEANASWAARAKELASGIQVFGCTVDMTKVNITEVALRSLPDTLIFDDIERCSLSHAQLSGKINRFVEHQRKRVILIANSDAHKDKDAFDASREKLIGQVITLRPKLEATLAASWSKISAGQGLDVLKARRELIIRTFQEAGHQNLRLLLHSMRDVATMLDAMEPKMLEHEQSVDYLTATFLALHMAYHGGVLSKEDMRNRQRLGRRILSKVNKIEDSPDALKSLQETHPDCNIEAGYNDVLPEKMGYFWIVEGYFDRDLTREALRETHKFSDPDEQPDWVRLWKWHEQPLPDLESAVRSIAEKRKQCEITEPGEILQIFGAEQFIAKHQESSDVKALTRKWYNYICDLSKAGKIRPAIPTSERGGRYGFSWSHGTIAYHGLAFEPDRRAMLLARRLQFEMDSAFERNTGNICIKLLKLLSEEPSEFVKYFTYNEAGENYSQTPILHRLPLEKFASILLSLFDENRQTARLIANTLSQRRLGHNAELALERPWFDGLEKKLLEQSGSKSGLYAAQVSLFISRDLKPS